jgi:hypothetical protein
VELEAQQEHLEQFLDIAQGLNFLTIECLFYIYKLKREQIFTSLKLYKAFDLQLLVNKH